MGENAIEVSAEVLHFVESAERLIGVGSHRTAAEQLEHAVVLCSDSSHLWVRLGTCYREQRDSERAEYCYMKARALDPSNFDATFHSGVLKMDLRQWHQAVKYFEEASRLNPTNAITLMNLASSLLMLERKAEWNEAMKQALALDPSIRIPQNWESYLKGQQ